MLHPLSARALSLEPYRGSRYVVFDFETTNLEFGSPLVRENRIVMVA